HSYRDAAYVLPMFVHPPRPRYEQPDPERCPRQRALTRRRRTVACYEENREHDDIHQQSPAPNAISRARRANVCRDACRVDRELEDVGDRDRVPPSPTHFRAGCTRPEWKIRTVHRYVEKPVAHNEQSKHPRSTTVAAQQKVCAANQRPPDYRRHQTVGERIVNENERTHRHEPGYDANLVDAEQQQNGPQLV